jgi:hypothetical protein
VTTAAQVTVPATLMAKMAQYVDVSSLLAKKALDSIATYEATQKKAAEMRPAVLDRLMTLGLIAPEHKQAADAMLGAHPETMSLLKMSGERNAALEREIGALKTANEELVKKASARRPQGDAADDPLRKQASDSLSNPLIGARSGDVRASDLPLLALIGRG